MVLTNVNPKKILSESARGWRRNAETNRTWGWLRNRCGEGILYTLNFRCEQQFYDFLLALRLDRENPTSDICPSALYHRETHTLSRSQRDHSVTHRKDYKPFQILKNVKDQLFYLIEFGSQCFNTSIILYYLMFVKDYLYKLIFLRKMDMLRDLLRDKSGHIWQHLVCSLRHNST